jgi:hypothetical protein
MGRDGSRESDFLECPVAAQQSPSRRRIHMFTEGPVNGNSATRRHMCTPNATSN